MGGVDQLTSWISGRSPVEFTGNGKPGQAGLYRSLPPALIAVVQWRSVDASRWRWRWRWRGAAMVLLDAAVVHSPGRGLHHAPPTRSRQMSTSAPHTTPHDPAHRHQPARHVAVHEVPAGAGHHRPPRRDRMGGPPVHHRRDRPERADRGQSGRRGRRGRTARGRGTTCRSHRRPARLHDDLCRALALARELQRALEADLLRFDASDPMPRPVWQAFNAGMVTITRDGPDAIDAVLTGLDATWDEAIGDGR